MSGEEDGNIPSAEECQKRIDEFVKVTDRDEAFAQMCLQDNDWNLATALDTYFIGQNCTQEAVTSTIPPESFTHISWNIDGLSDKNIVQRTKAVIDAILHHKADIVCLQEVIGSTLAQIKSTLTNYECIYDECVSNLSKDAYFVVVLVRKMRVYIDGVVNKRYEFSRMCRAMLKVDCHIGKAKICIINTHLESGKDAFEERENQLKYCFKEISKESCEKTVIFGGDLNLRDKELTNIGGIPPNMYDIWMYRGSRAECKYTWDMTRNTNLEFPSRVKPRCRFDRLYMRNSSPVHVVPQFFGLVGLDKVPFTQSFPSDHWGIITMYKVKSS